MWEAGPFDPGRTPRVLVVGRRLYRLIWGQGCRRGRSEEATAWEACDVRVAKDGPEALAVLARGPVYDFIVLDVAEDSSRLASPLSGWRLLRAVRDAVGATTRVLVVSALDEDTAVVRAFQEGADQYVPASLLTAPGGLGALMSDHLAAYPHPTLRRRP